jgi:hypothetical protein
MKKMGGVPLQPHRQRPVLTQDGPRSDDRALRLRAASPVVTEPFHCTATKFLAFESAHLAYNPSFSACFFSRNSGLVRLAGDWWLVLICCERKILLAGWWLMAGAELV